MGRAKKFLVGKPSVRVRASRARRSSLSLFHPAISRRGLKDVGELSLGLWLRLGPVTVALAGLECLLSTFDAEVTAPNVRVVRTGYSGAPPLG